MKRVTLLDTVVAPVLGGALLGGGGGGSIEEGLQLGRLAVERGGPILASPGDLDGEAIVLTVSSVCSPSARRRSEQPDHYVSAVERFLEVFDIPVAGLITNEPGGRRPASRAGRVGARPLVWGLLPPDGGPGRPLRVACGGGPSGCVAGRGFARLGRHGLYGISGGSLSGCAGPHQYTHSRGQLRRQQALGGGAGVSEHLRATGQAREALP